MNIFFSGIGGVGIGPLAEIAHASGHTVFGSDLAESPLTEQLRRRGVNLVIGQDGSFLETSHAQNPLDWFVYTAALPHDHPELQRAAALGIRTAKRDVFLAKFLEDHALPLIAVSGTHGKTTTTAMLVWCFSQLGVPISYSVGATLSFGASGAYTPDSAYFVYECDEYDKNFLQFAPYLSVIPSIDYDHPDTYPTELSYQEAFRTYIQQSAHTIAWQSDLTRAGQPPSASIWSLTLHDELPELTLPGDHNRRNASLVYKALEYLGIGEHATRIMALNSFPGSDRRFEQLAPGLYSDYGHHPLEIAATLQLASELNRQVTLIYQPHQNIRQHDVIHDYKDEVFKNAQTIFWLPTYLSREDPTLPILSPQELTASLKSHSIEYAELNDELWQAIEAERAKGALVLLMGAGTIDAWARTYLEKA